MRLLKLCPKLLRSLLQFLPVVANSVLDGTLTDRDSILVMFSPPSHRDNKLLMLQVMIYHASLPAYIKNPDHPIQLPMLRKQFR